MAYDPFARGPYPAGVRTARLRDASRDRALPVELWYPGSDTERGRDLDPAHQDHYEVLPGFPAQPQEAVRDVEARAGRFPLVVFSHGYSGDRRQSTHFTTHLASHGYVVASVDHTGNTTLDVFQNAADTGADATLESALAGIVESATQRPSDVSFVIDQVLAGAGDLSDHIDENAQIGMTGHSFGGWTSLMVTGNDERVGATLPLAPAGGSVSWDGPNPLGDALSFEWHRDVPVLYLVAERDTLLPLGGMRELLAKTPSSKRMIVLENADHLHFCNRIEVVHEVFRTMPPPAIFREAIAGVPPFAELCPAEPAYAFLCGLAHFDANLKRDANAARFLEGDLRAELSARGIAAEIV